MEESAVFAVALVGFVFAVLSRRIEAGPLSAPIIFTVTGIAIGPLGLGLIDISDSVLLEVVATTTLALVLFEDAASIKFQGAKRRSLMRRVTARLLGLALPITILAGAVVGKLVFPDLAWAEAFVLALVLALVKTEAFRKRKMRSCLECAKRSVPDGRPPGDFPE